MAVAGRLIGIDPFDQPDVESARRPRARPARGAARAGDPPAITEDGIDMRSSGLLDGVDSLDGALEALLARWPTTATSP